MQIQSAIPKSLMAALLAMMCTYSVSIYCKNPARVIAGWIEKIHIEDLDFEVKAKLDTGARTSSIHATNIEGFMKDGERWVRFTLPLVDSKDKKQEVHFEKPRSRRVKIKTYDGVHDRRYVVDLQVCFNGRKFTTEFTLADRSEYIYDVLLGRQFLKHAAIVDSNKTFLTLAACN